MPVAWETVREFVDIKYERFEGIAKITINRPEVRNAFRPETIFELQEAFADARDDPTTGVVLLTGEGPDAFCSGGDQRIRGDGGYVDPGGVPRLNVLDLQRQIRLLDRCRGAGSRVRVPSRRPLMGHRASPGGERCRARREEAIPRGFGMPLTDHITAMRICQM